MKGIIAAAGMGTRLYPITKVTPKSLLPIYDKPMIYYPLSLMMISGIKEVLIVCSRSNIHQFKELLGDGKQLGMEFSFMIQDAPRGIADVIILAESFINGDNVCLILGDTVIFGHGLTFYINKAISQKKGATIFGYRVANPSEFGVVELDEYGNLLSIEEKSINPKSNIIIPGIYFYDNQVVNIAKEVKPSKRGELEITSVNNVYLEKNELNLELFSQGIVCIDTGKPEYIYAATNLVKTIQENEGQYIGCIEELAYKCGFINIDQLHYLGENHENSVYGKYLLQISSLDRKRI